MSRRTHALAASANDHDLTLKMLVLGSSGVGKTSLMKRFVDSSYSMTFASTIGIDFKIKTILLLGRRIKLQIWDTAGQERFRSIAPNYYKGTMAIALVYDVTERKTFDEVEYWMKSVGDHIDNLHVDMFKEPAYNAYVIDFYLVGNKIDDATKRCVSTAEGTKRAQEFGIPFIETSAAADVKVTELFTSLAKVTAIRRWRSAFGESYEESLARADPSVARRVSSSSFSLEQQRQLEEPCGC